MAGQKTNVRTTIYYKSMVRRFMTGDAKKTRRRRIESAGFRSSGYSTLLSWLFKSSDLNRLLMPIGKLGS